MNDLVVKAIAIIIVVCIIAVSGKIVAYINKLVESMGMEELLREIADAVDAYEQKTKEPKQGRTKKAQVVAYISNWLKSKNIDVTEQQLDVWIEAAVFAMNRIKDKNNE